MKEITYTLAELCEQIEKAHGPITEAFSLRESTDYRCPPGLRIWVGCKGWSMKWHETDDGRNVRELLGMPEIVGFEWHPEPGKILKVAVKEKE